MNAREKKKNKKEQKRKVSYLKNRLHMSFASCLNFFSRYVQIQARTSYELVNQFYLFLRVSLDLSIFTRIWLYDFLLKVVNINYAKENKLMIAFIFHQMILLKISEIYLESILFFLIKYSHHLKHDAANITLNLAVIVGNITRQFFRVHNCSL